MEIYKSIFEFAVTSLSIFDYESCEAYVQRLCKAISKLGLLALNSLSVNLIILSRQFATSSKQKSNLKSGHFGF